MAKFPMRDGTNRRPEEGEFGRFYDLLERLIVVPKKELHLRTVKQQKETDPGKPSSQKKN